MTSASQTPPSASFTARLLLTALVVALALFLWAVRDALMLAFAAVLLAIAVHGIADAIRKAVTMPKGLALALGAFTIFAVLAVTIGLFGAQLASAFSSVMDRLPDAWARAKDTLEGHPLGAALVTEIERFTSGNSKGGSFREMVTGAGGFAFPFASGVTTALLVLFAAAFITTSASAYCKGVLTLFPKGVDDKVGDALDASGIALRKWLLGITVDMIVIAVLIGLALWLLGVPAFIGLALIAGVAQFVPTVGPLVSAIPGILLAFTVGPMTALWTALAYLGISQLEANLIYPMIQKKAASIPPALTLVAILAFGMLLGPLGVLLATPMLVVVTVFVTKLYVQGTLGKDVGVPGD
ncbi:AI-2E family transporter [Henriciella sp.]|uniref:AI-2E family transporter n=1 Tax=Henriciella sp. TaxID=1968823 RepID=UPI0026153A37|nr:AI-2E family transporter [Henriciella sp.]